MSFFGATDLAAMLADFGVDVVFGSRTGKGIVDTVDRDSLTDQSVTFTGREMKVTVDTGTFGTLKSGNDITVDGVACNVIQTRRIEDGALTEVMCIPT